MYLDHIIISLYIVYPHLAVNDMAIYGKSHPDLTTKPASFVDLPWPQAQVAQWQKAAGASGPVKLRYAEVSSTESMNHTRAISNKRIRQHVSSF